MSKKSIIWTIVGVAVLALLAIPKIIQTRENASASAAGKPAGPPPPVRVSIYVVKKQTLTNTVEAVGNLMAEEEVELRSEAQGRVTHIYFHEGDRVKKGQLLIKINDADITAQLKKALAVKKLKEETERRDQQLLDKGGISREAYEMSSSDLSGAEADVELLREQLRKTELLAPFDGVIGLRSISEGGFVTNANIIARLQDLDHIKLEFPVPEKYAGLIHPESDIVFTVEGRTGEFHAKVYAIEPKVDPVSRNVLMRARCENTDRKLLPGAFAKINLTLQANPDALMIPSQSMVPVLKGQKVFIVHGDTVADQRIAIGSRTDVTVEATSGLKEGDSVVVNGVIQMKPGLRVKVSR